MKPRKGCIPWPSGIRLLIFLPWRGTTGVDGRAAFLRCSHNTVLIGVVVEGPSVWLNKLKIGTLLQPSRKINENKLWHEKLLIFFPLCLVFPSELLCWKYGHGYSNLRTIFSLCSYSSYDMSTTPTSRYLLMQMLTQRMLQKVTIPF